MNEKRDDANTYGLSRYFCATLYKSTLASKDKRVKKTISREEIAYSIKFAFAPSPLRNSRIQPNPNPVATPINMA